MRTETEVRRKLAAARMGHEKIKSDWQRGFPDEADNALTIGRIKTLEWLLDEPESIQDLAAAGVATLERERKLEQDLVDLREKVKVDPELVILVKDGRLDQESLAKIERLVQDRANLREEVEMLRDCRYLSSETFSHAGCRHAEAPKGAVVGPEFHWSTNLEDARSDHRSFGGFLLLEGTHYVVVEEFDDENDREPAFRLRTKEQYKALEQEGRGWSEAGLEECP